MTNADRAALAVLEQEIASLQARTASKQRLLDELNARLRAEEQNERILLPAEWSES